MSVRNPDDYGPSEPPFEYSAEAMLLIANAEDCLRNELDVVNKEHQIEKRNIRVGACGAVALLTGSLWSAAVYTQETARNLPTWPGSGLKVLGAAAMFQALGSASYHAVKDLRERMSRRDYYKE